MVFGSGTGAGITERLLFGCPATRFELDAYGELYIGV
jgi:hypothetical protein